MTNRLPPEELLHVIRITQFERRAEARPRREVELERPEVGRIIEAPAVRGVRRPIRGSVARWLPAPRM